MDKTIYILQSYFIIYTLLAMEKTIYADVSLVESKLDYYRHSFAEGLISKENYEAICARYSKILKQLKGGR